MNKKEAEIIYNQTRIKNIITKNDIKIKINGVFCFSFLENDYCILDKKTQMILYLKDYKRLWALEGDKIE